MAEGLKFEEHSDPWLIASRVLLWGWPMAPLSAAGNGSAWRENTMTVNEFGIRPGEVAVALPEAFDAGVYFIGRIRTPWTRREECPKNARESDAVCTIEVDPRYAAALTGVESCSHLLVLYWMDKSRRDLVLQVPRTYGEQRGTFALRSPARPNPVAASVATLLQIAGDKLSVVGLDCLDGTPLIDIKPYFASTDSVPDAVVGWHQARKG
jgi:tRNA-Thr(GGU) m(6)t(6)A37 methyltransferase TsaA